MFRHTIVRALRRAALVALLIAPLGVPLTTRADEGSPSMLQDVNTRNLDSNPRDLIAVGQTVYFTASTPSYGRELWKSDGTADGTLLVKDINAGAGDAFSLSGNTFVVMDGALFFLATDNGSRWGLWRSDGTEQGTTLVQDIYFGEYYYQAPMVSADGTLFFIVTGGSSDMLWKSDGSPQGTVLVKELPFSAHTSNMVVLNGTLFLLNSGASGALWRSDGTSAGTVRVGGPEYAGGLLAIDNTLFFSGAGINGSELWKSDGTNAGTAPIKAFERDTGPGWLTSFGGKLLFVVAISSNTRSTFWQSDGTVAGTIPIKDFTIDTQDQYVTDLTVVDTSLFFFAAGGLWRSDGTAAGTTQITSVPPSPTGRWSRMLANNNGSLFFLAGDTASGDELWHSDGTAAGTMLVAEINPGPASSFHSLDWNTKLPVINGALVFPADDGNIGNELWRSDGSAQGTRLVKDVIDGSSMPTHFTRLGNALFFTADDGVHGRELWTSDSASLHMHLFKDIYPGAKSAFVDNTLISMNGALYFTADDGVHGLELWKSDGTPAGTALLRDVDPGANGAQPRKLTAVGTSLFFTRNGQTAELWRSDGTAAGTLRVSEFGDAAHMGCIASVGGRAFFCVQHSSTTTGLFLLEFGISDGTAGGTTLLAHVEYPSSASSPQSLIDINGTLFFALPDALWASDGTPQGTRLVKNVVASELTNINGDLVFAGDDGSSGRELWSSDGRPAGTRQIADINAGPNSARPANLTRLDAHTFLFSATTDVAGTELWRSDGTAAGTALVLDLNPGAASSLPRNLKAARIILDGNTVNGMLFSANDGASGDELWQTDGTAVGTRRVQDINPGKASSSPAQLTIQARDLFFAADDGMHGREPWHMSLPDNSFYMFLPNIHR